MALRTFDLWWWRREILRDGERQAGNLALIVAEHLQHAFTASDQALRQLAIHSQRVGGPIASDEAWGPILAAAKAGLTGVGGITITDRDGTIRHSTQPLILGQSRRGDYLFERLSTLGRDDLIVSTPFLTISEPRQLVLPIGRPLLTTTGQFDGVVVTTFNPGELRGFFRTIDVGEEGLVWVFHPSGMTLFREPGTASALGASAHGNPIFEAASAGGTDTVEGRVDPDGPVLRTAFRSLQTPPLIVAVSLSTAELLQEWRRELIGSIVVLAALGVLFATTLFNLRRQTRARAAAEDALARVRRLESIGRLTGGIAHDFNNLLTAILGYTKLSLEELEASSPLREYLVEVEKAGDSAAALTRQLLAFSRKQVLEPRVIDLNDIVRRIDAILKRVIGEHITFTAHLGSELAPVYADPGQMEQVVMNLVVNARDAMPKGGQLTIETANVDLDKRYTAEHPGASAGPQVMMAVSDTGAGMDDETKAHIFEPFFTTKKRGEGTGLGLATVYGIIKQSGGSIWVYSELGVGTTFKVYLPRATQKPMVSAPPVSAGARGTETVLLAEDQEEVRAIAQLALTRQGYTVLAAADGEEALRIFKTHAMPIDLLLTDVIMPKLSGRDLVDRVRELRPTIRVLYTSGYTDDAIVRHGVLEPGAAFLQKPFTPESLLRKVREVLDAA